MSGHEDGLNGGRGSPGPPGDDEGGQEDGFDQEEHGFRLGRYLEYIRVLPVAYDAVVAQPLPYPGLTVEWLGEGAGPGPGAWAAPAGFASLTLAVGADRGGAGDGPGIILYRFVLPAGRGPRGEEGEGEEGEEEGAGRGGRPDAGFDRVVAACDRLEGRVDAAGGAATVLGLLRHRGDVNWWGGRGGGMWVGYCPSGA
jgi:hypothetical protein